MFRPDRCDPDRPRPAGRGPGRLRPAPVRRGRGPGRGLAARRRTPPTSRPWSGPASTAWPASPSSASSTAPSPATGGDADRVPPTRRSSRTCWACRSHPRRPSEANHDHDTSNPCLTGNFGPVTEEITAFDLEVTGTIPDGLDGRLLRNGPNPRGEVDPARTTGSWATGWSTASASATARPSGTATASSAATADAGRGRRWPQHQRHRPCRPHVGHRGVRHPSRRADR